MGSLDSANRLLCLPEKGPHSLSLRRGTERRKTSHPGRVLEKEERGLVGVISCWASMTKVSSGRIREPDGESRAWVTWRICQGGPAAGEFYQIVNCPFRTASGSSQPPLASPRGQRPTPSQAHRTEYAHVVCSPSLPAPLPLKCPTLPVRCIFQNCRSGRRPIVRQTL